MLSSTSKQDSQSDNSTLSIAEGDVIDRLALPLIPLSLPLLSFDFIEELGRIPRREIANPDVKNEQSLKALPVDIWLNIFSDLDIISLTQLMLSCRTMRNMANDNSTRERLYIKKQEKFYSFTLRNANMLMFPTFPPDHVSREFIRVSEAGVPIPLPNIEVAPEVSNPGPRGFVMQNRT